MESYPPEVVSQLKALAHDAGRWLGSQLARTDRDADASFDEMELRREGLLAARVFDSEVCQQLCDIAVTAAAVTLCSAFGLQNLEQCRCDFAAASEPRPQSVSPVLWQRTLDMFWSSARLVCAEQQSKSVAAHQEQRLYDRLGRNLAGIRRSVRLPPEKRESFSAEAARVMPATVLMLSMCSATQPRSPRTPYSATAEGSCTEALLKALEEHEERSCVELLWAMRRLIDGSRRHGERQVPVLSCSRQMDLSARFSLRHPRATGRCRALLVGIGYVGQEGLEMHAGHRNAAAMRKYLLGHGYADSDVRVLADDKEHTQPTKSAIHAGLQWLVKGAAEGDSLVFHYSGHGCSFVGSNTGMGQEPAFFGGGDGNEKRVDDHDEALCPVDFHAGGMIFDDELYRFLVAPLREGVQLICVIDCCQSGAVLHLPFAFRADEERLHATGERRAAAPEMEPNEHYDPGMMLQVIQGHPAMCIAAAHWADVLSSLDPGRHRSQLGPVLHRVAATGESWAAASAAG